MKSAMAVLFVVGLMWMPVPLGGAAPEKVAGEEEAQFRCPLHREMKASWSADCPTCGRQMTRGAGRLPMWAQDAEPESARPEWVRPERLGRADMELERRVQRLEHQVAQVRRMIRGRMRDEPPERPMRMHEDREQRMERMMERMPQPMRLRHKILMEAEMRIFDPASVLALKEDLELGDEQIAHIETIAGTARAGVRRILSDHQQQRLERLAETPSSMKGMHQGMMRRMREDENDDMHHRERRRHRTREHE